MSLTEEIWTVQSYIKEFVDGCPNHLRPTVCPHCLEKVMLHKHGSFKRTVYTLLEAFNISIFRFKCMKCGRATSLLPNFVMEHHQVAWDVKEEIIRQQLSGVALAKISETLETSAGKFSEKTLWRWNKAIRVELRESSSELWRFILEKLPHVKIPVGSSKPVREFVWLFGTWEHVRSKVQGYLNIGLLEWIFQNKRSRTVTVG